MTASGANSRNSRSSAWLGRSGIAASIDQLPAHGRQLQTVAARIQRPLPYPQEGAERRLFHSVTGRRRRPDLGHLLADAAARLGDGGTADGDCGAPEAPNLEQPLSPAEVHGRDLFVQHCGSCHTFDAAGTVGQIGPNLDDIAVNEADVLHAIKTGGGRHSHGAGGRTGNMPRNLVTGQDARRRGVRLGERLRRRLRSGRQA